MAYVIGVTGGVGAGKSSVLDLLKNEFGVQIILADEVGRELMEPDCACFLPIRELFGPQIVGADGRLDRAAIAAKSFANREVLEKLNAIVHPAVKEEIIRICRGSQAEYIAIEAALLLEAHYEDICDEIWYVYADEQTRRIRLKASRGYSDERIDSVMANQLSEEVFRAGCDRVIDNSGSLSDTREQIWRALGMRADKTEER